MSLHLKKFRETEGCFLAEGHKLVEELLASKLMVKALIGTAPWFQKAGHKYADTHTVYVVEPNDFKRLSTLSTPAEVMAVAEIPSPKTDPAEWPHKKLVIDRIQDPGNLGTIIRTADWFGFSTVFLRKGTVEAYNPKTIQSAMGSLFRVNLVPIGELATFRQQAPEPWLGADLSGQSLRDFQFPEKGVLFVGQEGSGLDPELVAMLDHKLFIPGEGGAESLNVAVATGIVLNAWSN